MQNQWFKKIAPGVIFLSLHIHQLKKVTTGSQFFGFQIPCLTVINLIYERIPINFYQYCFSQ
jgi:hypothetical protein